MPVKMSKVYLLSTPLDNNYQHTFYFQNANEQFNWFSYIGGYSKKIFDDFTYQRKDNKIRVPLQYEECLKYNYVMYNNESYTNKWFYAFIKDVLYVAEDRTDIVIETDVIQTWMFDIEILQSFVEREHVSDDTIGLHTIPEGLQMGEYIINDYNTVDELKRSEMIVMGSTVVPSDLVESIGGNYNGIYSGVKYYQYTPEQITIALQKLADEGKADAVSSLFLVPYLISHNMNKPIEIDGIPGHQSRAPGGVYEQSAYPIQFTKSVNKEYGFEGYVPKNNKLKTHPYTFLLASNGNGGVAEYMYEYFESSTCDFSIYACITPGCSIRMIPTIYKGSQLPETEGLNLGKYPQCNWATDQYTNWLTQNGINLSMGIVEGGMSIAAGAAVGGAPGAVIGGVFGIAQTLHQTYLASRVPPQTKGNINCGDVVTSHGDNTYHFYNMSIKKEYAEIIDNYFSMFGYKVNKLKVPNKNHRKSYWYTKTIDVNIMGNVPKDDLAKIKDCYNKGITFWLKPTFNYDVDNSIKE